MQEPVSLADAQAASEIILFAGDTHIFPVTKLDGVPIGDGSVGEPPPPQWLPALSALPHSSPG